MSILIGTLPPPIIESILLEPPGKVTVTMSEVVADLDPPINIPDCPVPGVIATGYEMQTDPQGGFGKIIYTFKGGVDLGGGEAGGG